MITRIGLLLATWHLFLARKETWKPDKGCKGRTSFPGRIKLICRPATLRCPLPPANVNSLASSLKSVSGSMTQHNTQRFHPLLLLLLLPLHPILLHRRRRRHTLSPRTAVFILISQPLCEQASESRFFFLTFLNHTHHL